MASLGVEFAVIRISLSKPPARSISSTHTSSDVSVNAAPSRISIVVEFNDKTAPARENHRVFGANSAKSQNTSTYIIDGHAWLLSCSNDCNQLILGKNRTDPLPEKAKKEAQKADFA
jgi:hypothetical protein